jgi:hypothetical protein
VAVQFQASEEVDMIKVREALPKRDPKNTPVHDAKHPHRNRPDILIRHREVCERHQRRIQTVSDLSAGLASVGGGDAAFPLPTNSITAPRNGVEAKTPRNICASTRSR